MAHILRRSLLVVALVAVLTALALPAMATDEPSGETTEIPAGDAPEPAVPIPDEAPEAEAPEWSYRFLVPATLVLGTLAVVGTIFMYFVRVTRNRYRVVDQ